MRKLISFMHISLDGYVAGPNGEMNWIKIDEEIFDHVENRIARTDTALYGRMTFQMMESYWPTAADKPDASKHDKVHSEWYKNAQKVVLSKTLKAHDFSNTIVIEDPISESLLSLKKGEGSEILVFGSPSATHALQKAGLIDGYWLFINPVVLGKGISLFLPSDHKVSLQLTHSHAFSNGVIAMSYDVI